MKRNLLFLLMLIVGVTAYADDYGYLTFETADGTKVSVPSSALTITISGGTLTAGSQSFVLANLSKMYFTTSAGGSETGIESVSADDSVSGVLDQDESAVICDLQGRMVEKGQMRQGQVYVVKSKSGTRKIVKK